MIEHIKQRVVLIVVTHSKAYLNCFDTVVEFSNGKIEIKDVAAAN
jgi:ABC-type lipoprotein export system ATPase subunit